VIDPIQIFNFVGAEGKTAVKRSLPKTPLQKETLEAAFNGNEIAALP
jgi:hypothetical protein